MLKNVRIYADDASYRTAKRNHMDIPNVCLIEDTHITHINPGIVTRADAKGGDIVAFDNITDKMVFIKPEYYGKVRGQYTPEAIVVIPETHTPDGTVRAMSLKNLDGTHDTGVLNFPSTRLMWSSSNNYKVNGITDYTSGLTVNTADHSQGLSNTSSFISSDYFYGGDGTVDNVDIDAKWGGTYDSAYPSPYNTDESKFELYGAGDNNVLSDMDGFFNTSAMMDETTSTLTFPAAAACRKYYTPHFSAGRWYLPAAGEMGYFMARFGNLIYTTDILNGGTTATVAAPLYNSTHPYIWTSSEYDERDVWTVDYSSGKIYRDLGTTYYKRNGNDARAFIAL